MGRDTGDHGAIGCRLAAIAVLAALALLPGAARAQHPAEPAAQAAPAAQAEPAVAVDEVPPDARIQRRLERIFAATGWYQDLVVEVSQGVVFLDGVSPTEERSEWAAQLARRTEGVVGVANRLRIDQRLVWDFEPAWSELRRLSATVTRRLPLIAFGALVLVATALLAWLARVVTRAVLGRRLRSDILLRVVGAAAVLPVVIVGLYVFLQVAGLTRLAATVLGGTGLMGLVIGIAFRDVAENFLASILISVKRPFRLGHLIEVDGKKGFVQSVTTRGTLLMTLDGNHVHIPNADIYKGTVYNYSANPRSRFDFTIGIDYGDSITAAQDVCLATLRAHEAVLDEPEPLVLVEQLAPSSVVLRVYFWVDIHRHSAIKVVSSVIRKVKAAVEAAGLTLPDEAREVIVPRPIVVRFERAPEEPAAAAPPSATEAPAPARPPAAPEDVPTVSAAEGNLESQSEEIREQARTSESLDLGPDLLDDRGAPRS